MTSYEPLTAAVREGLRDDLLVDLVREVVLEVATVDGPLAAARDDADAGDGLLAAAGGAGGGDDGRAVAGAGGARVGLGAVGDLAVTLGDGGDLGGRCRSRSGVSSELGGAVGAYWAGW